MNLEIENWLKVARSGKPNLYKAFAPVVKYDPVGAAWLTMPFATDVGSISREERASVLAGLNCEETYCPDLRIPNWGRYQNRPIVIDYGMPLSSDSRYAIDAYA